VSDVLIIGSGFGGSIAAKRFTEAGHRVTLLELGESWADPSKLQQSQDPAFVFRLVRDYPADYLRTKPRLRIAAGMGLGGGSLVYAGIHLRAPAHAFERWPAGWTRAHLDPYYARVEHQLAVAPMLDAFAFGRAQAFRDGALAAGLPPPQPMPLAMQGCTRCGWCVPICAFGKKRTMQHTYLADAQRTGRLTVVTHRKAAYVARVGQRYRVWAWRTDGVATEYHRVNRGPLEARDADLVVVAGGAIESPALLARSLMAELSHGAERLGEFPTRRLGELQVLLDNLRISEGGHRAEEPVALFAIGILRRQQIRNGRIAGLERRGGIRRAEIPARQLHWRRRTANVYERRQILIRRSQRIGHPAARGALPALTP
jgi:cholesterol oxidase